MLPKTLLTCSQADGNEYMSPTSQTKEDDSGEMKAPQAKQDVTSTQTPKHPTQQGLAKDTELCKYLIVPLSVPSILSPICCPNVSSIWEIMFNLDATLEPI